MAATPWENTLEKFFKKFSYTDVDLKKFWKFNLPLFNTSGVIK